MDGQRSCVHRVPMLPSEDALLPPTAVTAADPASATPVGTVTLDSGPACHSSSLHVGPTIVILKF